MAKTSNKPGAATKTNVLSDAETVAPANLSREVAPVTTPIVRAIAAANVFPTHYVPPDPLPTRLVTVEQLAILRDSKRDMIAQFGWASLALAAGAAPSAIPSVWRAFIYKGAALGAADLVQTIMLSVGIALAIGAWVVVASRGKKADDLYDRIVNPKG